MAEILNAAFDSPWKSAKIDPNLPKLQNNYIARQGNIENINLDLSLKDLLELSAEEEQSLLHDLFKEDVQEGPFENLTQAVTVGNQNIQNIENQKQVRTSVIPKMIFQKSTIRINFNVNK